MPQPNPSPVYFGTIAQNPSAPQASNYGGFDRLVSVEVDDYGPQKIWFPAGTIKDYLSVNDRVILEYTGKKWKFCKQQAPELLAALKARQDNDPASRPPVPPAPPTVPSNVIAFNPQQVSNDLATVDLMAVIFTRLEKALPQLDHCTVAKLACTVFIQLTKQEK